MMNSREEERGVYEASTTPLCLFNLLFQLRLEIFVSGSNCSSCIEIHHKCVSESNQDKQCALLSVSTIFFFSHRQSKEELMKN